MKNNKIKDTNNVENVISQEATKEIVLKNSFIIRLLLIVFFILSGAFIWLPGLMFLAQIIHNITGQKHVNLFIAKFDF